MTMYAEMIRKATDCKVSEIVEIEEIMRDDIFHSTLDWQTQEELSDAARLACKALRATRS